MGDRRRPARGVRKQTLKLPPPAQRPASGLPAAYRAGGRKPFRDLYDRDQGELRQGGGLRWLIATCLAAGVGAIAIFAVIYGSIGTQKGESGLLTGLQHLGEAIEPPRLTLRPRRADGLPWAAPKADKLVFATGAFSTRYVVEAPVKQRQGSRDYIKRKPYVRLVARLSPVPPNESTAIPAFNPFKLYSSGADGPSAAAGPALPQRDANVRVVDLIAGVLPDEDGQKLENREVAEIAQRALAEAVLPDEAGESLADGADALAPSGSLAASPALPPQTTELAKPIQDFDPVGEDSADREVRAVKIGPRETLVDALVRAGAERWQARTMAEAAHGLLPDSDLIAGQELQVTFVPSLTQPGSLEAAHFTAIARARDRKITVARNAAGEFVARVEPFDLGNAAPLTIADSDVVQDASVYASVFYAGLLQKISAATILQIMRIHAYATDFRRRVRVGDSVEFFFGMGDNAGYDDPPGELLFTAISAAGETARFWRFKTPDGVVDYYDEHGSNSKKFLMRKPVRGSGVRLTDGFGMRMHPILNEKKMHTGVDWATTVGTPILSSGNGTIEEAGRKGGYGLYIRIRHANGYQTAYAHMLRVADGIRPGLKVRQGQIIGYVGTTGLSSGAHLHYEVLINNRFVDPLSIQVPQEHQLGGKQLAEFQKERARIDDLMRLPPVREIAR